MCNLRLSIFYVSHLDMPAHPQIEPLAVTVRLHAEEYRRFAAAIAPPAPPAAEAVFERYLFALLSRHCELGRTVRAFRLLRGHYHADAGPITALLRGGRIGFYNTWAPQIAAFTRAY